MFARRRFVQCRLLEIEICLFDPVVDDDDKKVCAFSECLRSLAMFRVLTPEFRRKIKLDGILATESRMCKAAALRHNMENEDILRNGSDHPMNHDHRTT